MDLVAIGRISKPRGIKGELVADILTDFPERFASQTSAIVIFANGERQDLEISGFFFQKGRIVLKFKGIDTIESAEMLRNAEICIPESDVAELEDGAFFDWQLEGCVVKAMDGQVIGKVESILRTGGTEILIVKGDRDYMIPFAEAICTVIDIENKLIIIDPPEGLLEF